MVLLLIAYFAELLLLDLEDWCVVGDWQGQFASLVIQAWSRERLDTHRPP